MSSTRLPGKVLMDLGAGTALDFVLRRLARCREIADTTLATSTHPDDDAIASIGKRHQVRVVRGPLDDVLRRYQLAAEESGADAVVRITADCPLVDPGSVDRLVTEWRRSSQVYVANVLEPRTWPKGLDCEVISRGALDQAAAEATTASDREHVTAFVRDRPHRFPARGLFLAPPAADLRVTLDTEDDLETLRELIRRMGPDVDLAGILQMSGRPSAVLREHPST